ncbi:hypothetical protein ACIRRA_31910 [Nocardia sp. NPDC101769]|uniref:hypothetical protein n=1 Tax=Nocardia sp. NPDC101769 TaxID=3364333 RepID=UPI003813D2B6
MQHGKGAAVRGTFAITSDISDVLALEAHAARYDATGQVLGAGSFRHDDEAPDGGAHTPNPDGVPFTITASAADAPISAVALSIPGTGQRTTYSRSAFHDPAHAPLVRARDRALSPVLPHRR